MIRIYCLEDINDNKYIGSTSKPLNIRLSQHKNNTNSSSSKLNLYNSFIYTIEICEEKNRYEKEQYWIDNSDCVNIKNAVFDKKKWYKEYRENNKIQIQERKKECYKNNKQQILEYRKEYYKNNKQHILENNKEYYKREWFCECCDTTIKLCGKSRHLKTKRHLEKANIIIVI